MAAVRLVVLGLACLACLGAVVLVNLLTDMQAPISLEESPYFDNTDAAPFHNSFIRPPSLQELAGHDHDPNDNSLRLHLLSKFVQKKLEKSPPRKQELNGLWQRLAYARKVLGSDANEILGPKKRDRYGNIIKKERRYNRDSFEDHLKSSTKLRQLSHLRRLLKSQFHLSDKNSALAQNSRRQERDERRRGENNRQERRRSSQQPREREETEAESLEGHPGATQALAAVLGVKPTPKTAPHSVKHFVTPDNSQKLVIEGGPITGSGPVAVVGWLHRDQEGDWAGKLFPKSSAQGLKAIQSPKAGGKGWFDGTIEAAQLQQRPAVVEEQPVMEVPAQQQVYTPELSQPLYEVANPLGESQASLDPQIDTAPNEFEIEPSFQIN